MKTASNPVQPQSQGPAPALTVYFDGACPVCRREIALYRQRPGADQLGWVDAAHCPPQDLGSGLDRGQALQRLHVRLADGRLLQGAPGFAALWQQLPGWRWLGRLAAARPVAPLMRAGYALFLRLRPLWRAAPARRPSLPAATTLPLTPGAAPDPRPGP